MSRRPNSMTERRTALSMDSRSDWSRLTATARPPSASTSATTARSSFALTLMVSPRGSISFSLATESAHTTAAPISASRRIVARPIPGLRTAPATNATLPVRSSPRMQSPLRAPYPMTIAGSLNSSIRRGLAALLIAAFAFACADSTDTTNPKPTLPTAAVSGASTRAPSAPVEQLRVEVISRRPHDRGSFTEGLEIAGGRLYESSGLRGESTLREVDARTGAVTRKIDIDNQYFGEGIAVVDDRIIQLTWQEHTAFVYRLQQGHDVQLRHGGVGAVRRRVAVGDVRRHQPALLS